ncbi:rod shape-determining protein RodA [Patescibacteria group bacterium]|nr:MAG: rod shape-determining protein RodA [Patescibacteria group bacterium]
MFQVFVYPPPMLLDLARLRRMDWPLAFAVFALLAFGLAAIYSVALSRPESDFLNVKKQLLAAGVGLAAFLFAARGNYRLLRNWSVVAYAAGVLMLGAVLLFGEDVRGTTGWFDLGTFRFQPVEYMKFALAVALAAYFSSRARPRFAVRELVESGLIAAVPAVLVMLQPDLGSALLLMGLWGAVCLFAGMRARHLVPILAIAALVGVVAWQGLLAPYQKARILSFIDPSLDPLGEGYNVAQAIIAVGSGGLFGSGLGFGSQSQLKFLPESQTDFIFAVIAEELGFFGVVIVLSAFAVLFVRLLQLAAASRDDFTSHLLIGFGAMILVQLTVNVGANLGLMPVTGVTLPLVSYGGSSLLFTLLMLGVAQSVAVHSRRDGA